MSAPTAKPLQLLAGTWKLDKSSSDGFTSNLAIQSVGLLIREAASAVSVPQPDTQHVEAAPSVTAGKIPGTTEEYVLDWEWRINEDPLFGEVQGRSRWVDASEAQALNIGAGDWIEGDSDGKLVHAEGKAADGKWEAKHLRGFEMADSERKHTRREWMRNNKG